MYTHLLVATDGSELSERAVRSAALLTRQLAAQLTICYVCMPYRALVLPSFPYPSSVLLDEEGFKRQSETRKQQVLEPAVALALQHGVSAQTLSRANPHPWAGILEAADASGADLIVMASHGYSGLAALLLGSETQKLLVHTSKSVLVVR